MAEWAPPVLTSPAPESEVGGAVELTATSESPYVVFELGPPSGPIVRRSPVAADEDGVFRDTLPTVGLNVRFRAQVRACADLDLESCTTVSEYVVLHGQWPHLVVTGPRPSTVIDPSVTDQVSLRATNLGDFPATASGDGVPTREVREGDLVDIDVSRMSNTQLLVSLQQCNPLNALACVETRINLSVRTAPDLTVSGHELFVSPNGDGFSDTATAIVQLDRVVPVTARWRVASRSGATVAGPYEFSAAELDGATSGYQTWAQIVIDLRKRLVRPLPSGEYRFEVETTAAVAGFTKSARKSVPLFVSSAAPITKLTPTTRFFYPHSGIDPRSGVPTRMAMSPALDAYEARFGRVYYRILASDGRPLGGSTPLIPAWDGLTWNGSYWRDGLYVTAPAGTYRIELVRARPCVADVCEKVYGPVSAPFALRGGSPPLVDVARSASARSSRQRTVKKRYVRIHRGKRGLLRYEPRRGPKRAGIVTTIHSVRVAANRGRDSWLPHDVRLRGSWGNPSDIDIAVVTPNGRTLPYAHLNRARRHVRFSVEERWIHADGRLRFKVRWKGTKPARLDRFVVRSRRYDLTS